MSEKKEVTVDLTPHAKGRIFKRFNVRSEEQLKDTLAKTVENGKIAGKGEEVFLKRNSILLVAKIEASVVVIITAFNLVNDFPKKIEELDLVEDSKYKVRDVVL